MVADAAQRSAVDHLHGNELGAEGQDVKGGAHRLVLLQDLGQSHALATPAGELEHGNLVGGGSGGQDVLATAFVGNREDSHYLYI